ncbi:HEPN domain-containing protein [Spirosoma koreense]
MNDKNRAVDYLKKAESDLTEARLLLEAGHPDGTCNRAYYALFDSLLALLHSTDGQVPKTHTGVHNEFRKRFILTGIFDRRYSNTITELFNLRQGGDYEIDFDISQEDAQDAVERAVEFLLQVEVYLRQNNFTS